MADVDLRLGDCLELMGGVLDKTIDVVITDPPYGIRIARKTNKYGSSPSVSRKATDDAWDDNIPTKEYFDEIKRISKNQIVFGANYFWEHFYASKCYIIWDKRGNLPDVPFAPTEFAWTSFVSRMCKRYVVRNHGFIRDSRDKRTKHPTQKPSELFVSILRDFTKEGDTILDPFMGSGTTGVACVKLNRNFIGFEIHEPYFEIAKQRINTALAEPKMMEEPAPKRVGAVRQEQLAFAV